MKKVFFPLLVIGLAAGPFAGGSLQAEDRPRVEFHTSMGRMVILLYPEKAPATVSNFLQYVEAGFYDNTIFHRVIPNFMIQGGGFTPELTQKDTREPIPNEADGGLPNERGTVAMARTQDPHSATAQFFVNLVDNPHLDYRAKNVQGWGYTAFGRVVEGMSTVDAIAQVPTKTAGMHQNVPVNPVVIVKAGRLPPGNGDREQKPLQPND